jgi:hypothetical protein
MRCYSVVGAALFATDTHRLPRSNRGISPRSWEGHEGLHLLTLMPPAAALLTMWEPPPCGDLLHLLELG